MHYGSLARVSRKEGPALWQFRWSEKGLHGTRIQRKRVIGTVERYQDETAARAAVTVLLGEINSDKLRMGSRSITVAQLCDHFEQRELAKDNTWLTIFRILCLRALGNLSIARWLPRRRFGDPPACAQSCVVDWGKKNGGDDETRTRDLCRDSGPLKGFTTTYKTAGTARGRLSCSKSHKTPHCVGWVVG